MQPDLEFFNGLGGFAVDGREYVTILGEGQWTPAPWINVIANPHFGFQVSESGSGYTWSLNSRENQLTSWSNDPVTDPPSESIYVRDEDSGELWSPTVLPIREEAWPYIARHGQGYSRFEHASHGVSLGLLQFVPLEDPIKISRLTFENYSGRPRRLSVTAYVEWVLGVSRSASAPFVVTEVDPATGMMFARNAWNGEFSDRVAFADLGGRQSAWTGDRTEFLGRNGTLDHPMSLERGDRLSGKVGAGLDPCAALQTTIELRAGGRAEIVFFLGEAATTEEARALITRYRGADLDGTLQTVMKHWDDVLGALQVTTPDRAMNIMLNRWLLYQTLVCRVWSRSAFYQAGGAYGFRDQLQDVMALTVRATAMWHARRYCGPPHDSSLRAMSSTGGIRPPDGACGPVSPMIFYGCRTPSSTTLKSQVISACSRNSFPSLTGPLSRLDKASRISSLACPNSKVPCSNIVRALSTAVWPLAATAFR